jgi:hypothetical protein
MRVRDVEDGYGMREDVRPAEVCVPALGRDLHENARCGAYRKSQRTTTLTALLAVGTRQQLTFWHAFA